MYKAYFFFILLMSSSIMVAQPEISWTQNYGGSGTDKANSIKATPDGGYILVGDTYSEDLDNTTHLGSADILVMKLTEAGDIEWQRKYGGTNLDFGQDIIVTEDNSYILTGFSLSTDLGTENNGFHDFIVMKLTKEGEVEWQNTYGGADYDYGRSIIQTSEGGYILVGSSYSKVQQITSFQDILVIKLTNDGEVEWQNYYGGSRTDTGERIYETADGGYIVGGTTSSSDGDVSILRSSSDYWIFKLSKDGDMLWEKTYGGGSGFNRLSDFFKTSDGGYVLAGKHGGKDYWIIKIDNIGNLDWQKSLGGSSEDIPSTVIQTRDQGYVVAGVTQSADGDISTFRGIHDIWLFKLDSRGVLLWEKTYGGSRSDNVESLVQLVDDSYIIAGSSDSLDGDVLENNGGLDYWVVKFLAEPSSTTESFTPIQTLLFPNPTSDIINLEINEKTNYKILNINGQSILQGTLENHESTLNVRTLNEGSYMLLLKSDSGNQIGKFVKK